ncbi:MAG: IclR family transcriptional regulator C-terminal domain-containing protein [Burkholderiales bacterium]
MAAIRIGECGAGAEHGYSDGFGHFVSPMHTRVQTIGVDIVRAQGIVSLGETACIRRSDFVSVKTINGLTRGLAVRRLLMAGSTTGLADLHRATGIPKASLLRILATLELCGEAQRIDGNGEWIACPAGHVRRSGAPPARSKASEAGRTARRPLLAYLDHALTGLAHAMPWPSDAAVRHGPKMRVVASNRARFGKAWRRVVVGREVDMLRSAMGRTWLAFSGTPERDELLAQLIPAGASVQARRIALLHELALVRERGYGLRDPLYSGPDADSDAHLSAFAVPVLGHDGVLACVSCVWDAGRCDAAQALQSCLVPLVRAAAAVQAEVTR